MTKSTSTAKQQSFSQTKYEAKKKRTRRDIFLARMENVVPWSRLLAVTEPHYSKSGKRGLPPIRLEHMLRMYFIQQWYGLADEAVEDALYDSQALRHFCGIDLNVESVPDATTAIVLWNTVYLERAVHALRDPGKVVDEKLLPHLSPLGWEHINLAGDYIWRQSRKVEQGKFRPLRMLGES